MLVSLAKAFSSSDFFLGCDAAGWVCSSWSSEKDGNLSGRELCCWVSISNVTYLVSSSWKYKLVGVLVGTVRTRGGLRRRIGLQ